MKTRTIAILGVVGLALVMALPLRVVRAQCGYDDQKHPVPCGGGEGEKEKKRKRTPIPPPTATFTATPTLTPTATSTASPTPTEVVALAAAAGLAAGAPTAIPPTNADGSAFLLIALGAGALVGSILIGLIVRARLAGDSDPDEVTTGAETNLAELHIEPERDEVP